MLIIRNCANAQELCPSPETCQRACLDLCTDAAGCHSVQKLSVTSPVEMPDISAALNSDTDTSSAEVSSQLHQQPKQQHGQQQQQQQQQQLQPIQSQSGRQQLTQAKPGSQSCLQVKLYAAGTAETVNLSTNSVGSAVTQSSVVASVNNWAAEEDVETDRSDGTVCAVEAGGKQKHGQRVNAGQDVQLQLADAEQARLDHLHMHCYSKSL